MAYVAGERNELVSHVRVMYRAAIVCMMDDYGFQRPDKLDFEYDIQRQAVRVAMKYGNVVVLHLFEDPNAVHPDAVQHAAEMLAQDARIPIAQEL